MGINAKQVRGDSRTEELQAKNDKEIQPVPLEITEFADANPIYIFNVSPYSHKVEHPSIGVLTIPACPEGEEYSEPATIKGMQPYGVPVDMQSVEIRHDSGRLFALDLLGLGAFRDRRNSLLKQGVFIATGDTLDLDDLVPYKMAPKVTLNVPRWVRYGKCPSEPTAKEIQAAQKNFEAWDFELIKDADRFWDAGPGAKGHDNIDRLHREALRRRKQTRPWDQPIETLVSCPGCGEHVRPGIIMHRACGYVFDMDRAVKAGMVAPPQAIIDAAIAKSKAAQQPTR